MELSGLNEEALSMMGISKREVADALRTWTQEHGFPVPQEHSSWSRCWYDFQKKIQHGLCVFFNMIKCIVPAIKYIMIYFILLFCRNFWLLCCLSIQNIFFFQKGSVLMKKAYHKRTLPLLKDGLCHRVFFYMGKVIIPSFKYVIVLLCLRFCGR